MPLTTGDSVVVNDPKSPYFAVTGHVCMLDSNGIVARVVLSNLHIKWFDTKYLTRLQYKLDPATFASLKPTVQVSIPKTKKQLLEEDPFK